ncbi:MAG TPA: SEC-C domain-containing protein [Syntrophomonadaceae bacterium]|nr:SEC-C domain-containing protein [Syntrophomonadaceae bacterium]HPR92444.1 SEC-C domain-containing protein [Syntrophomonadaceae bacterium]
MANIPSHENSCSCGSGKPYEQCCGSPEIGTVIHFHRGRKNKYSSMIENAVGELTDYARQYFYNWKSAAYSRFTSYAQENHIDDEFIQLFREWFIINFRFQKDVSPVIDFYLAENDDKLDERLVPIFKALKESYLSIYRILWIKNNTMAVKDILTGKEFNIEKDLGSLNRVLQEGLLLLARIVNIGNTSVLVGKPKIIFSENRHYLNEEINSIRAVEGISDPTMFQREFAEVTCGLIMDLYKGIKKNRLKSRSFTFALPERDQFLQRLLANPELALLERNDKWLKLTWNNKNSAFTRLYLCRSNLIVTADELNDLINIVQRINLLWESFTASQPAEWTEGYSFSSEQEAEEILVEVMHDKYFEEWINTPHLELDEMTPLQAIKDTRGRILLESLLNELEIMELRARSRGEYYFPIAVMRARLSLDRDRISKEMMQPEAIALQVRKHRTAQELSVYVTVYNWVNDETRTVAIAAFDYYSRNAADKKMQAWILFIWNEFSKIYRPKISQPREWLAALEHSYLTMKGEKINLAAVAKKFNVSTSLVSKKAQLIVRHFQNIPLNFSTELVTYPYWNEINNWEKIKAYEEVKQHLKIFSYSVKQEWGKAEQHVHEDFYDNINTAGKFWDESNSSIYEQFYQQYYELDCQNSESSTIANLFWESQAKRFPASLKTAAFNLITSYVGAYKIIPVGRNELIFEDYFTGKRYNTYGNFGANVHHNIVPGMISITRLLPLDANHMWVTEPMFSVMPDMLDLFEKNYQILMERFNPFDITDIIYLKNRGKSILKANIMAIDDIEQNTVNMMNQPLHMEWQIASVMHSELLLELLFQSKKFQLLHNDQERASFIWINKECEQNYQWGYLIIKQGYLLVSAPPGKELNKFIKDIRRAVKCADIVIAFRPFKARIKILKTVENLFVADLADFFHLNPDLSLNLLRQDNLADEDQEWKQGIFLLKLGNLLMEHLNEINKPAR